MRLGIDLTGFNSRFDLGIGRYISELIPEIERTKDSESSVTLLVNSSNFLDVKARFPNSSLIVVKVKNSLWLQIFAYLASQVFYSIYFLKIARGIKYRNVERACTEICDVLYVPTTYLNFKTRKVKTLVSLHDLQDFELPENFSRMERKRRNLNSAFTVKYSSKIQVSSNFIHDQFKLYFQSYDLKISMIPEGVNLDKFASVSPKIKSHNFLYPAFPWIHKNHQILFDCIEILPDNLEIKFILTCSEKDFSKNNINLPDRNRDYLEFRGRLGESDLIDVFQESNFILSCSLYESSSLPLLEGMAAGCIPLASKIPAHQEMANIYQIQLFDPKDPLDLQSAIMKLITSTNSKSQLAHNKSTLRFQTWGVIATKFWQEFYTLQNS
jgi:glycosyltransferase involved in cell wall biosynthesis